MSRPVLNDAAITHLASQPPAVRLDRIRERLDSEREAARTLSPNTFEGSIAARNVERLEKLLTNQARNLRTAQQRETERQAEAARKSEATRQAAHDAETQQLRTAYFGSAPAATEQEFQDALPRLREDHRARNAERDQALLRERYRL